jgi:hypothetical protein
MCSPGRGSRARGAPAAGAGAALVPDDGYRLLLGEPGSGGERPIDPGRAQPVPGLGHQIGLYSPQMRPGLQADPPAQALGRAFQQRRPLRVAVRERQLGIAGQAKGHERGATGRQAKVKRLIQQASGGSRSLVSTLRRALRRSSVAAIPGVPMTAEGLGHGQRRAAGDALQLDHNARLVTSIHAPWPGRITERSPGPDTISCQSSARTVIR